MAPVKPPAGFSPGPEMVGMTPPRVEAYPAKSADKTPLVKRKERPALVNDAREWVGTRIENVLFQQYQTATRSFNHIETSLFVLMHDYVGEVRILEKARGELRTGDVSKTAGALMEEQVCKNQIALEAHLQYARDATKANIETQTRLQQTDPSKIAPDKYENLQKLAAQTQREQERAEAIYKAQELAINTENRRLDEMISAVGGSPRTPHERHQKIEEMKTEAKAYEGDAQERYMHRFAKAGRSHKRYEENILQDYQRITREEAEAVEAMKTAAAKIVKSGNNNQIDLQRAQLQRHRCQALRHRLDQEWIAYNQAQGEKVRAATLEQRAKEVSQKPDDFFTQLKKALQGQPAVEPARPKPKPAGSPAAQASEKAKAPPPPAPLAREKAAVAPKEAQPAKRIVRLDFSKLGLVEPEKGAASFANSKACFVAVTEAMRGLGFNFLFAPERLKVAPVDVIKYPNHCPKDLARDAQGNIPRLWLEYQLLNPVWDPNAKIFVPTPFKGALNTIHDIYHTLEKGSITLDGQPVTAEQFFNMCHVVVRNDFAQRLKDPQNNQDALQELALDLMRYAFPPANIPNPEQFLRETAFVLP
jgi:hypothetical protein